MRSQISTIIFKVILITFAFQIYPIMTDRRLFVGGNWKSNDSLFQTKDLIKNVLNKLFFDWTKVDVVIAPITLHASYVLDHI